MVHIVAYDLVEPNDVPENYEILIDAIKKLFPTWCHIEKSVWVVKANRSAVDVRDALKPFLHDGDEIFVAALNGNWASWNAGERRNQWMHDRKGDF